MTKKTTVFIHASKDSMWDEGVRLGLKDDALENFRYACYEVKLGLEVDQEGNAKIVTVDDKEVVQ